MAAKKNPLSDKAYELYKSGMKLVDIAAQLNCSDATIRTWKNRYKWDSSGNETFQTKSETKRNVSTERGKKAPPIDDGTKETLQNDDLTPEQQMFCIYYIRTFNATQSYLKAFHCSYDTANAEGYKLLVKPCVRKEIERLKEIKRQQIVAGADDIVELQMRIAFSDFSDIAEYDAIRITPKDSKMVDTQLIKKAKETQYGVSIEVEDRQKAIDWLTKFFEMNPGDRHRKEFDKRKLDLELLKLEMQTKDGAEDTPEQDNFLNALNESAKEVWSDD